MLQRIDFVGNANSYPLTIARGMRALGYDVHMHLLDDYYLNDPANLYPEYNHNYPGWIHDWRPCNIPFAFDSKRLDVVAQALADADALVVNLGAVALACGESRPYFCLLTGTDLLTYCDESFLTPEQSSIGTDFIPQESYSHLTWLNRFLFFDMQRAAIRNANGYSFFPRSLLPAGKDTLESIGADVSRQCSFLVTDIQRLAFTPHKPDGHEQPLRILVAARCTWDRNAIPSYTEQDYKGTDVFLRGAAQAIRNGLPLRISLFRKGAHLEQTETLVQELNLEQHCAWHEEITQYEFHEQIKQHDIVIDSLDASHIGMAAVDSFAIGRPVIARQPQHAPWGLSEPFPICHALSAEDVAYWLWKLSTEQGTYTTITQAARTFAETYLSPELAAKKILASLKCPAPQIPNSPLATFRREMYMHTEAIAQTIQHLENQAKTLEELASYKKLLRYFFQATKDKFSSKFRDALGRFVQ